MKLIIWDFDGVTADTEKYWLAIELEELNKYCGLAWDFATINKYLSWEFIRRQKCGKKSAGVPGSVFLTDLIGHRGWIRYWSFRDIAMQWLPAARWRKPCLN